MNTSNKKVIKQFEEEILEEKKEDIIIPSFGPDELRDALYWMEDFMERAHLRLVLAGGVARDIYLSGNVQEADKLEFLVKDTDLTRYAISTMNSLVKDYSIDGNIIHMTMKNVPVEIKVLSKDKYLIKNPDKVFYLVTQFEIPNPFEEYWELKEDLK